MKASEINYLVDAGPVVGLFSLNDQWHAWSTAVLTTLEEPIGTTETVWAEICHLLARHRPSLLEAVNPFTADKSFSSRSGTPRLASPRLEKYPRMDAGDASPVALSEAYPKAKIITTDVRDFSVYRRFRGELLPLIHS